MKKRVRVTVTRADIAKGGRCRSRFCPIARAMSRALGWKLGRIGIAGGWGDIVGRDGTFNLPPKAAQWVQLFDEENVVKPFTFTVTL